MLCFIASQRPSHEVKGVSYNSSYWPIEERISSPVEETMHEKKENPQEKLMNGCPKISTDRKTFLTIQILDGND